MKSDISYTFGGKYVWKLRVTKEKKGGGTDVVPAKWTQILKLVMT